MKAFTRAARPGQLVVFQSQPQANKEQVMSAININHVVLTGRLTSDPELRALPSGSSVCGLRVAVNARRRDSAGEWVEKPNFFDVVVFGAPGENVAKYMRTGRPVAIDGRLDWREWETKDGRHAQAVRIVARTVQFLDSPPNASTNGHADDGAGALQSVTGDEEDELDVEDQEAIALAAA
jgi:single-strand DNA-binding protein